MISPLQVYSVTISKFPTAANFPIEIQGSKTKGLFDKTPKYLIYPMIAAKNLHKKTRINTSIEAKVHSADRSHLGPIGIVICSLLLHADEFEYKFIVCKNPFCPVILELDFAYHFRVGKVWNNQAKLYLHQNQKLLTYSQPNSSKDSKIFFQ